VGINAAPWLQSLVVDGVLAGVGGILVFLPQLAILFFALALLEYSGYMARAAFITDRFLMRFGLSGMSFIPMILGFGCTVPALMACRSLDNKRERLLTMIVVPFMSCSAKMPVYALLTVAFFAAHQSVVIFSLYVLGALCGLLSAILLKPIIIKKEQPIFLMEMPPYRKPVWHCVWRSLWVRVWGFLSRAGSVILIASIIIWFLSNFNRSLIMVSMDGDNILKSLGSVIAPIFAPLGFGNWQLSVSLLTGFMAKEAVVSTLTILYGTGVDVALQTILSPVAAFAFLVFVLLYTPCVASIATVKRESKSWGFTFFVIIYQLCFAWLAAFIVYQVGRLIF
jgi:ferrous iron transport protein B